MGLSVEVRTCEQGIEGYVDESQPVSSAPAGRLHRLPRASFEQEAGEYLLGDGKGENQAQARALENLNVGLSGKAQRLALCGRLARPMRCEKCGSEHKSTFRCGLRSCPTCAPRNFDRLFAKYLVLDSLIPAELKCRPGWGWKDITFTFRHYGRFPSPQAIRGYGRVVRAVMEKALRDVTRSRQGYVLMPTRRGFGKKRPWGTLRASEFGFDNTNVHFNVAYFGPLIPQKKLSRLFEEETGGESFRVWIERSRKGFASSLAHALKYTAKLAASTPEGLADLEAAFDGTRRVQTAGLFYGVKLPEFVPVTPRCPVPGCGGFLKPVSGWVCVDTLAHLPEYQLAKRVAGSKSSSGDRQTGGP
jgi:hypothetical protein